MTTLELREESTKESLLLSRAFWRKKQVRGLHTMKIALQMYRGMREHSVQGTRSIVLLEHNLWG